MRRYLTAILLALILTATSQAVIVNLAVEVTAVQIAAAQRATAERNVDVQAYNDDIIASNARIDARNIDRAAQDPPLDPLPPDPREPRDLYTAQTLMTEMIVRQTDRWVTQQGKQDRAEQNILELWDQSSDATKAAVRQLLIDGA